MFGAAPAVAQKVTTTEGQVWLGYFNQTRLSQRWGLWLEGQVRTREDYFSKISAVLPRAGLTYYLNDHAKLTAGYAYLPEIEGFSTPEHRPWQQLQWHTSYPRLRLMQWVRLEERFRKKAVTLQPGEDKYSFNYRARYNFLLNTPLGARAFEPGTVSLVVNDEVMLNFGKEIVQNTFDQNRLFLGFHYHINRHNTLQFGYLNVFQQLPAGNRYRYLNVARIGYFQNLDLRRRKAATP